MLSDCGIVLIFLPHLKGSFLQGASFMDGNKIVVGLTARGKDADKFWFSLFHEIAHIVLGHIGQADGTTEQDEKAADSWARDTLISEEAFLEFEQRRNYSASNVYEYAKKLGIAPGILVGRLQNEGCIKHSMLNDLKEHYEIAI
jgi:HTH-type transcriptional regulator/antitoxin HigA